MRLSLAVPLSVIALLASSPTLAQSVGSPVVADTSAARQPTIYDGDYLTVGLGVGYGPSYEGSDDDLIFPAGAVQGHFRGIGINARAYGFALDLIDAAQNDRLSFNLGPVIRLRRDRVSRINDRVVSLLGKRSTAVELGVAAGVTLNRPLTGYDTLTANLDVTHDVAGAHKGTLFVPSLSYLTPVSQGAAVFLSVSAEHTSSRYADYYYSVSPVGSLASGLPVFRAGSGWKNIGATAVGVIDLKGNLADGGFALYVGGNYSRLLEDSKRSPIVSIRGRASQLIGAVGLGFTF